MCSGLDDLGMFLLYCSVLSYFAGRRMNEDFKVLGFIHFFFCTFPVQSYLNPKKMKNRLGKKLIVSLKLRLHWLTLKLQIKKKLFINKKVITLYNPKKNLKLYVFIINCSNLDSIKQRSATLTQVLKLHFYFFDILLIYIV